MLSRLFNVFKFLKSKNIPEKRYSFSYDGWSVYVVGERRWLEFLKDKMHDEGYQVIWDKDLGYCFFKKGE